MPHAISRTRPRLYHESRDMAMQRITYLYIACLHRRAPTHLRCPNAWSWTACSATVQRTRDERLTVTTSERYTNQSSLVARAGRIFTH